MTEKAKRETVTEFSQEFRVMGRDALNKIRELIAQGNVRRIIVRRANGEKLFEVPLTLSVVVGGTALVFAPWATLLLAGLAYMAELRLEVILVKPLESDVAEQHWNIGADEGETEKL